MARKEVVQFVDDLDGTELSADQVDAVEFSYRGKHYVIDLSAENAELFDQAMSEWIEHAHKVARPSKAFQPKRPARRDLPLVRKWARENGYEVSDRGRIPQEVLAAYDNR